MTVRKVGDLVTVYYETKRYYIVLKEIPRGPTDYSEQKYRLLCLDDGLERVVRYSDIKTISRAER